MGAMEQDCLSACQGTVLLATIIYCLMQIKSIRLFLCFHEN